MKGTYTMTASKKRRGFTAKDLKEEGNSPELTKADFAKAKPFSEVFPSLSASIRRTWAEQVAHQGTGLDTPEQKRDRAFQEGGRWLADADR
jgi:hypothetical protein